LSELKELEKKYSLEIGGCGCCGSPFLKDVESDNYIDNIKDEDKLEKQILKFKSI
jgi:hypothetical protein